MSSGTVPDQPKKRNAGNPPKLNAIKEEEGKERTLTLKEKIEDNLVLFTLSLLAGGFIAGFAAYGTLLQIIPSTLNKPGSEISKIDGTPLSEKDRTIPKSVSLHKIQAEEQANWITNLVHLLDIEGAFKKQNTISADKNTKEPELHFGTEAFEYEFTEPTRRFDWVLNADNSYSLTGLGFYFNKAGGFYAPLEAETDANGNQITFRIPPCEKGDKFTAVLRVESTENLMLNDLTSAFRSVAK